MVSVQAGKDSPLYEPSVIAAMAKDAELGGADGFRVDGPAHLRAVRAGSDLPIIGIHKQKIEGFEPYITTTAEAASTVVESGAQIVAIDSTDRPRPVPLAELFDFVRSELGALVMADCSTADEAILASELGADLVSTTMAGYTPYTSAGAGPAFDMLSAVVSAGGPRVIVEGRVWTPDDVKEAFDLGAFALVVGTAITSPRNITKRLRRSAPRGTNELR